MCTLDPFRDLETVKEEKKDQFEADPIAVLLEADPSAVLLEAESSAVLLEAESSAILPEAESSAVLLEVDSAVCKYNAGALTTLLSK